MKHKEQCLARGGEHCPFCDSGDVTLCEFEYLSCKLTRHMLCSDCRLHWRVYYQAIKVLGIRYLNSEEMAKRATRKELHEFHLRRIADEGKSTRP